MRFGSMGLHRNALWLSSIAVSLILLTGINRSQGAVSSKPSLPERYANLADRAIPGYKINPKPCRVKGREGTCMFVWECIKTEGQALGMCVEGFMFGSCCAHDVDNNVVPNSNPNQPDDHLPVSTTFFGLPTRPVTSAPPPSQNEKEDDENSEQEVTMAPSLITSKPLVVDMAPVTVEPVEATIASVWQKPTASSTSTTTTPATTTTERATPSSAPPTSSAPLFSSNSGTEPEELLSMTTSLPETTTPDAQLSDFHTSTPLAALPVPTNASHTQLTNGTADVTTNPTLHFTPTGGPAEFSSTLPKNESLEVINVSPKPATEAGNVSPKYNVTLSPFWTGKPDTVTRPPTTVAIEKIKPNQHVGANSQSYLTLNKRPTPRPLPTSTTFKTKVTLGGQRRSTTVRPLRTTTVLSAITPATIQRFTPTRRRTTARPKTTISVNFQRTTPATPAPHHNDPVTIPVVNSSFSPDENRTLTVVTSTLKTTIQEPPPVFTSTLSSVLGSTVSPAHVSFPEVTSPIVSATQSSSLASVTGEPTSLANSPTASDSTTTSAFTTESSSPGTTVSPLMTTTSALVTTVSSPVTTVSAPSTHSVLHSTTEKPSTAPAPVSPPTVTPVPLPEESTSSAVTTTTLIPTVSMITDNAWTPITQASKSPILVVSSTLGSTVAITTSTTQSSTATPTTTQPSRFPPTSAVTSIPSNDIHVECGVPQPIPMPELRIVGGRDAAFAAWPWQVSVRRTSFFGFSSTHRCGGALLNEQWVVTAGHCVEDLLTNQIRLRLGEYDFSSSTEPFPYIEKGASKKIVHPKYNFFTYEYDLALVRLEEPINFMPHIKPICLPAIDELMVGENATVTGWGRLSEGGTLPSKLQQVTVPIVSNEKCKNMFLKAGRHEYIPDIFMCAGYEEGGRDSCQGDSGGPLQARGKDGRYFLAGIISWGIGCAEKNLPGVCTRISKFTSWILENAT